MYGFIGFLFTKAEAQTLNYCSFCSILSITTDFGPERLAKEGIITKLVGGWRWLNHGSSILAGIVNL